MRKNFCDEDEKQEKNPAVRKKTRNSDRKKPGLERKLGNRESLSGTRKTVEDNDDDVVIEDNNNNDDDVNDVNDAATKRVE